MTQQDGSTEYPQPTPSTVKELYATGFRCAEPDCTKPLYRQDNDTGNRILNSRVCHVYARRPGGPRWRVMDPEENRSNANLLLLCIEHSYEIDDKELGERYPPELLFDWKRRQLEEYDAIHRSWPLSDPEAAEVAAASFDISGSSASAVLEVARSVTRLDSAARRGRDVPLSRVLAWNQTYQRARASAVAWDADGERIYPEPSRAETRAHRDALIAALSDAKRDAAPFVDAVVAELAAISTGRPELLPWCDWVGRAAQEVLEAVGRWPSPPPFAGDDRFEMSLAELSRSLKALTAKWRGEEPVEAPPVASVEESSEEEPEHVRLLREHRDLLDQARPFARVGHRPYDPELEERLRAATALAALLPTVPTTFAFDLHATAHLAAAVARNADDDVVRELVADAASRRPLAAAVLLVRELMLVARETGRSQLATEAEDLATSLLLAEEWDDKDSWQQNGPYPRLLLGFEASVTSPSATMTRLDAALAVAPQILCSLLQGCAEWIERRDSETMSEVLAWLRRYSTLPPWFPTATVVLAINTRLPHVTPASEWESDRFQDECDRLAAQVLKLAEQSQG